MHIHHIHESMSLPYFFDAEIKKEKNNYTLSEETSKHCVQVLRMKEGEELLLTDGRGNLYTAVIVKADKKHSVVRVEKVEQQRSAERKISIAISLLKNANRFEWFLEKATEIGVLEVIPIICKRTERQHFRLERMQGILIAAMLQSKQSWLPVLHEPIAFEKVVTASTYETKLIAHCEDTVKNDISKISIAGNTQILIGPEGDFTTSEIELALSKKFLPASLGNTRLRAETAGIVAATLLVNK